MTELTGAAIRRIVIEQAYRARVGHIGSALSVADILAAVYGGVLRAAAPADSGRDRFVLAKGHAALALYAALHLRGWISREELGTYCADGARLGVHPDNATPGVDFSTGSLGQGLSYATGAALAARIEGSPRRSFALLSDAECNEGAVWEAAMFAAHHRLSNLVAIVDANGSQALGPSHTILDLEPLARRWEAFGWHAIETDGHDVQALKEILEGLGAVSGPPHAIIARTVLGKGVSFMEDQVKWHYWPLSDEEFRQALAEVEANA